MLDLDAANSPVSESSSLGSDADAIAPHHPPPLGSTPPALIPPTDGLLTVERPIAAPAPVDRPAYYIQVIEQPTDAVLRTNLPRTDTVQPTANGVAWLLGRSRNCTIVFPDPAISRCHAVLSYQRDRGFQVMDAASSNGTCLNGQRLIAMQPRNIQDGDVITVSHIAIQLFIQRQ
jgi:pSer/pThr/pTyr-binding forkhead associated (FHA) protein